MKISERSVNRSVQLHLKCEVLTENQVLIQAP